MKLPRPKLSALVGVPILMLLALNPLKSQTSSMGVDLPKPEGSIRIGLASPRVTLIGSSGNVTNEGNSLRQTLRSFLLGPRLGTVDIKARLDSLAIEEARERQCEFVLYTTLSRKRAPGSTGSFGATKTNEEITFEYKLMASDGDQPIASNVATAQVKFDGEDVLTPLIENAAQAIVVAARKAKPSTAAATLSSEDHSSGNVTSPPVPVSTPDPMSSKSTGYGQLDTSSGRSRTTPVLNDPPKSEDSVRIGIVTPRVTLIGGGGLGKEASALSESFKSYLAGSIIETVDLNARLASLALDECSKRQCDYVLYISLIRKRQGAGSGSSKALGGAMGSLGTSGLGNKIPGGKTAQTVSSGASSIAGTIASLGRAKDEITLEYKLVAPNGGAPVLSNVVKAKVKTDGEDLLTPMIETAAQSIVDVTKKL